MSASTSASKGSGKEEDASNERWYKNRSTSKSPIAAVKAIKGVVLVTNVLGRSGIGDICAQLIWLKVKHRHCKTLQCCQKSHPVHTHQGGRHA